MEIVLDAIVGAFIGFIIPFLWQQYGYYISYKSNLDKLRNEVNKLMGTRSDMQRKVEEARKRGEEIAAAVDEWLNRVQKSIVGANKLIDEDNEGHGEVGMRLRLKLSKAAEEMAKEISDIITEGNSFSTVSFRAPPQTTTPSSARGYEALVSRTLKLDEINRALKDPNIYMIGVYGMGGAGKTTLMKELAWQAEAEQERSFGKVVMATITSSPDVRRIQGELADMLGLKLETETVLVRAGELRGRILQEKSILVILDDFWDGLDLTELGVPFGDAHPGCKLVLTSRDLKVLKSKMNTKTNFALEVLSGKESWDLFEKKVGDVVKLPHIKSTAREVVKFCVGLPLLIDVVANGGLKGEQDVRVWKDWLTKLQRSSGYDDVIETLKISYERLKSKELKSLFLLIGSLGRGCYYGEEFFTICWGLGIYDNVSTLEQGRDRHHTLMKDLKASSLLLEDEVGSRRMIMHDLVREMAQSIASTEQPTFVLERHPKKFECPQLKVLLLQDFFSDDSPLPEDFFSGMTELNVLHLFVTFQLPSSFSLLTKLTSLNLAGSKLEDITIIGELKSLEILIISGVERLKKIPKEIGNLTHLRVLNVNNCPQLKFIAKNVISNLKCLEELHLLADGKLSLLEVEESNDIVGELRNLDKLTTLELELEDGLNFPWNSCIHEKLKRYYICIGCRWLPLSIHSSKSPKILAVGGSSGTNIFSDNVLGQLLKTVELLYLEELELSSLMKNKEEICGGELPTFGMLQELTVHRCHKMENLFFISHVRHLSQLHKLEMVGCESITEVIAGERPEIEAAELPELHYLILGDLPKLHSLCSMSTEALFDDKVKMPNLTELKVWACNNLRSIFPFGMARGLVKLQTLQIGRCQNVEHIFVQDNHSTGLVSLPNLEIIFIVNLVNLKSLWHIHLTPNSLCKLKQVKISGCPNLLNIFSSLTFNNLEWLSLSNCGIESIVENSESDEIKNIYLKRLEITGCHRMKSVVPSYVVFQNLSRMSIFDYDGLVNIITPSTAASLSELQSLEIANCGSLEEIVGNENDGDAPSVIIFMKMEYLKLINLPMLTSFCRGNYKFEFPSLKDKDVVRCPRLKTTPWQEEEENVSDQERDILINSSNSEEEGS